jgi:hypothetical protein
VIKHGPQPAQIERISSSKTTPMPTLLGKNNREIVEHKALSIFATSKFYVVVATFLTNCTYKINAVGGFLWALRSQPS